MVVNHIPTAAKLILQLSTVPFHPFPAPRSPRPKLPVRLGRSNRCAYYLRGSPNLRFLGHMLKLETKGTPGAKKKPHSYSCELVFASVGKKYSLLHLGFTNGRGFRFY